MINETYELNGPFKNELELFINMRRSQGYDYKDGTIRFYRRLDNFFKNHNITTVEMPKDIMEKWFMKNDKETSSNQGQRYFMTRCFALYLIQKGYKNIYIPEHSINQFNSKFIPYIFNKEEMYTIIEFFDNMSIREKFRTPRDMIYPIIFRLLYSTGMRISEVMSLKWDDVDISNGILSVRNSKNHVSRLIPISNTMLETLKVYDEKKIYPLSEYLFKDINDRISCSGIRRYFYQALEFAKIERRTDMIGPRIHDVRHSFAVHSLEKMKQQEMDIYVCLPLLSKYMGHIDIKSTEYYLRLTANNFGDIISTFSDYTNDLFPKVGDEFD